MTKSQLIEKLEGMNEDDPICILADWGASTTFFEVKVVDIIKREAYYNTNDTKLVGDIIVIGL